MNLVFDWYEKIKFISVVFFLLQRQECFWAKKNSVKAGSDVSDILTGEDVENTVLEFRMKFVSGLFSTKTLLLYNKAK